MAEQYKIDKKALNKAGIEAKEGVSLSVDLGDGKAVAVTITKVEEDTVIVTTKGTTSPPPAA